MNNCNINKTTILFMLSFLLSITGCMAAECVIPDTGQIKCYNTSREIKYPAKGQPFFGQDAQYAGQLPAYRDNGDGTITDLNTGLMWSKGVELSKSSLIEARKQANSLKLAGHTDWRVPNIKELYSLIDFRGYTGYSITRSSNAAPDNAIPFINTDYFDFAFGNVNAGERYIDAQWLSDTEYVSKTMNGAQTLFGVNFADGRIKGYGYKHPGRPGRREKKFYVRFVRGNPYGQNNFTDNGDGTVTDKSTGLMWMKRDNGKGMSWQQALAFSENLTFAGHDDWRLPNAKELQYIVDYTRSPDTTNSAAINPVFQTTVIANEDGNRDYPHFWSSTTHLDGPFPAKNAAYIAFGRALGKMHGRFMDVHGAGAQRSDPKAGTGGSGHGPQGDVRRVVNFVRCVRGGNVKPRLKAPVDNKGKYPDIIRIKNSSGNIATKKPASSPAARRSGFVSRLDRNGDGKISRKEFDGPPDAFDRHDRNHDGYLSADEAPKAPPPGLRPPRQ